MFADYLTLWYLYQRDRNATLDTHMICLVFLTLFLLKPFNINNLKNIDRTAYIEVIISSLGLLLRSWQIKIMSTNVSQTDYWHPTTAGQEQEQQQHQKLKGICRNMKNKTKNNNLPPFPRFAYLKRMMTHCLIFKWKIGYKWWTSHFTHCSLTYLSLSESTDKDKKGHRRNIRTMNWTWLNRCATHSTL